jgi:H+-transporting ATPase
MNVVDVKGGVAGAAPAREEHDDSGSGKPQRLDASAIAAKVAELRSSDKGLTSDEAKARHAKDGPNAIVAKEEPLWHKALAYFWGPIPWMIEAAALISLVRADWPDFFVVTGLLLYNGGIGFWQDAKAASALATLKKGLALKARVLRDGKWQDVDAADLVVGDVTDITAGEVVPADLLLTGGSYLSIDQAALTGESLPVGKAVGDVAYSGSIAKQGDMQGVVTAIGNNTFFGRTAKLIASAGAKSHSQKAVVQIGDFLILLAAILAVVLVGVQVYRTMVVPGHWSWDQAGQIAQFVLVLLVASVPVALPAVMSVTLALGALALSKQKAIVSRLSAIDELAGVDILCSDKTGTLTQNKLTLSTPIPFGGTKADDIVMGAALATKEGSEDAIDEAVLKAVSDPKALAAWKQTNLVPFDPVNKRTMTTVVDPKGKTWRYAKGAPQAISALCKLSRQSRNVPFSGQVEMSPFGERRVG